MPFSKPKTRVVLRRKAPKKKVRVVLRRKNRGDAKLNRTVPALTRASIPNSVYVKLPYYSGPLGTTTTVAVGQHRFNLNNIFDPDATGTGHQPRGRDQWATLYTRYRVLGVQVILRFGMYSGTGSIIAGYIAHNSAAPALTDLTDAMESNGKRVRLNNDASRPMVIKKFFRPWVVESVPKSTYMAEALYAGAVGGGPATNIHLDVFWQNMDENTNTNVTLTAEFLFYTLFDIPVDLTGS